MKFVAFGDAVVDFLPLDEAGTYKRNFGGAPANACIAAARLGARAAFCGMLGKDDFGFYLADTLERNGVDITGIRYTSEAVTTMTFVTLDEKGDRDFVIVRKPGADMLYCPDDIEESLIQDASIVHFCSGMLSASATRAAAKRVVDIAKKSGARISFDVNYRKAHWRDNENALPCILEFAKIADILKVSGDEALMCSKKQSVEEAAQFYRGLRFLTIITLGEGGAICIYDNEILRCPGFSITAVDTTGAGDAFLGAFVAELIETKEPTREIILAIAERANAAAAIAVSKKGAISALPDKRELDAFLVQRK